MSEFEHLKGKVVAVTGGGRGIGREIALLCAREGAAVVVNDLGVSTGGESEECNIADAVVAEIREAGGKALSNTADISDPAGGESVVNDGVDNFGRLDAVVNNAGILRDTIFHKMSHHDWQTVINVNLNGTFNVSKAAALQFRKQEFGSFIHFTSTSGLVGSFGQANYSASKMGIAGLSRSLSLDMERFNVRSNCIAPFAWSRLIATIPTETEEERERVERIKTMTPAKVAPLVAYLCSDLSADVTGQIFGVRKNEIFVFSQPRPLRSVHRSEGWTVDSVAEMAVPAMRASFTPLERSPDVFSWDAI